MCVSDIAVRDAIKRSLRTVLPSSRCATFSIATSGMEHQAGERWRVMQPIASRGSPRRRGWTAESKVEGYATPRGHRRVSTKLSRLAS